MNITKTTLLRYLIGTALCAFSAQTISAEGSKLPYWKDIQTVAVNKEAPARLSCHTTIRTGH